MTLSDETTQLALMLLCGVPLVLGVPGTVLLWLGFKLHVSDKTSDQGVERTMRRFAQGFVGRQEEGTGFVDSLLGASGDAQKPGCLAQLFLYPGALLYGLLSLYFRVLLLPIRVVWWLIRLPFRWLAEHPRVRFALVVLIIALVILGALAR